MKIRQILKTGWLRLRSFATIHPVILGMTIAFIVMVYPITALIDQQGQLAAEQRQGDEQRVKLAETQRQIQQQRKESTLASCRERNARNRTARKFLGGLPVEPDQRQMTKKERDKLLTGFTDALVGVKRNCEKYVKRTVRTTKPKPKKEKKE